MMPFMRSRNSQKKHNITAFGGMNTSYLRSVGELCQSMNTSSSQYPAISSAKKHSGFKTTESTICGAGFYDSLYLIEEDTSDGKTYISADDTRVEIGSTGLDGIRRKLAFLKDRVLVIPDNVLYRTDSATARQTCFRQEVTQTSCQQKFNTESLTNTTMPMPYNTWYSAYLTHNSITSMKATYRPLSISYDFYNFSLPQDFRAGDIVTIKMNVKPIDASQDSAYFAYTSKMVEGITLKIKSLTRTSHATPSGNIVEYTSIIFDDNAIDMGGYGSVYVFDISVEKGVPDFVDICSFENRVWGVTNDEICASKLGEAHVFNDFSVDDYGTLPSSSFVTAVDTDGKFTAITAYNGNIHAFKEDCIHKIYGREPAEYSVTKVNCIGVEQGCASTLATVAGCLYYKGKGGIYRLNGSSVQLITRNIDISGLTAVCAGGDERYYHIAMTDGTNEYIYTYDTLCSCWHISNSASEPREILMTDRGMCMVCKNTLLDMFSLTGTSWNFAMSFGTKEFSSKHICRIELRYNLAQDGILRIDLKNKHGHLHLATVKGQANNSILTRTIPVSCGEDCELIFSGDGDFLMSSLCVTYKETGIN